MSNEALIGPLPLQTDENEPIGSDDDGTGHKVVMTLGRHIAFWVPVFFAVSLTIVFAMILLNKFG